MQGLSYQTHPSVSSICYYPWFVPRCAPLRWSKFPKQGPPVPHSQMPFTAVLATGGVSVLAVPGPAWQGGGSPGGSSCPPPCMGTGPITAVAVAVTPPSSSGGMAASLASAECAAEHLPGQERCVWPEIHSHGWDRLQCVPGCREEAQPVSPHVLERMSHVLSAGHPLLQQH